MTQPIRLMIAEDHAIMREGLKQLFQLDAGIKVVAEAADAGRVLELLRSKDIDLLLLDISMPGGNGEDLIKRISSQHPSLKILVLSMFNEPQIAQRMLEHGALGYITKDRNPEELLNAIHSVASGARYIDHELAQKIVFAQYQSNIAPHENLTLRERQIMIMLAHGESLNTIANTLAISNKTVSTYKSRLMKKMDFTTNADIIKYAISYNLVQ